MISFVKYQGAGNDFILIDDRSCSFPILDPSLMQELCHRKVGIGADGLILLQKDSLADFRMRIFNSDGYEAESCGNGLRCFARFIEDLGYQKKKYRISIGARLVEIEFDEDQIITDMGEPENLELNIDTEMGLVHFINTGVPHVVQFVSDVTLSDLMTCGSFLRNNPKFSPEGANVNIASIRSSQSLHARTFERGIEGETLACGTGALAIAYVANRIYQMPWPIEICFQGGNLQIDLMEGRLSLKGPAKKVYEGRIQVNFPNIFFTPLVN